MKKFIAAFKNEMFKIANKKMIYVLTGIMVFIVAFVSIAITSVSSFDFIVLGTTSEQYEAMKETAQKNVEVDMECLADTTGMTEDELFDVICKLAEDECQVIYYGYCAEYGNKYDTFFYLCDMIYSAKNVYTEIRTLSLAKDYNVTKAIEWINENTEYYNSTKASLERALYIYENKDFKAYIDDCIEEVNANEYLDDAEKQLQIEEYEFRYANNLTGEDPAHSTAVESRRKIKTIELSLQEGVDYFSYSQSIILPEREEELRNELAVVQYKIDSGYYGLETTSSIGMTNCAFAQLLTEIGISVLIIMMIILAGTIISSEVSTGAIKLVIVQPVKRWKIFLAKGLSLLLILLAEILILTGTVAFIVGATLGFETLIPYIYAVDGVAHSMPFGVYVLLYTLLMSIRVVFFASLAFMLSSLSKNSSVAIGVPIGLNFITSSIVAILAYSSSSVTKYLPSACLTAIETKLLSCSDSVSSILMSDSYTYDVSLTFALVYIAVFVFTMILTGRDSFCHKDIK